MLLLASASQIAPSGPSSAVRGCVSPGVSVAENAGGLVAVARHTYGAPNALGNHSAPSGPTLRPPSSCVDIAPGAGSGSLYCTNAPAGVTRPRSARAVVNHIAPSGPGMIDCGNAPVSHRA